MSCPCGAGIDFESCCEPYIDGEKRAPKAETLMRSRYSAYVKRNLGYIEKTISGPAKRQFDRKQAEMLMEHTDWEGLKVLASHESGDQATVEFEARFMFQGKRQIMHEISSFQKIDGKWVYVNGDVSFKRA